MFDPFDILSAGSFDLFRPDEGEVLLVDWTSALWLSFSEFFRDSRSWLIEGLTLLPIEDRDDWVRESIDIKDVLLNISGALESGPLIVYAK